MKSRMKEQAAREEINVNIRKIQERQGNKSEWYKAITSILNENPKNLDVIIKDLIESAVDSGNAELMSAILACKYVKDKDPSVAGQTKDFFKDILRGGIQEGRDLIRDITGREMQTKSESMVLLDLTGILKILEKEKVHDNVQKVIKNSGKLWEQQPENQKNKADNLTTKVTGAVKATVANAKAAVTSATTTVTNATPAVIAKKVIPVEDRLIAAIKVVDADAIKSIFKEGGEIKLKENPFEIAMKADLSEAKLKQVVNALLQNEGMKEKYFMKALKEQLDKDAHQPNIPFIKACFASANFTPTPEEIFNLLTKLEERFSAVTDGITFEKIGQHIELKQEVLSAIISVLDTSSVDIINGVIKPLLYRAVMDFGGKGASKYIDAIISSLPAQDRKAMMAYTLKLAVEKNRPQAVKAVLTSQSITDKERTDLLKMEHNGQQLSKWADSRLSTATNPDTKKAYEDLSGMLKSAKRYEKLENAAYKLIKSPNNNFVKTRYEQSSSLAKNIGGQLVTSKSKFLQSIGREFEKSALKSVIAKTPEWQGIQEDYASSKIAAKDVYKEVADSIVLTKEGNQIKIKDVDMKVPSSVAKSLYMEINAKLGEKSKGGQVVMTPQQNNNYQEVEKLIAKALQTNKFGEEKELLAEAKRLAFKDVRAQYKEKLGEAAIASVQTTPSR